MLYVYILPNLVGDKQQFALRVVDDMDSVVGFEVLQYRHDHSAVGHSSQVGSNPIAIAAPAEPYDFFFDASTTVVTRGKLEIYNKLDKPLPEGWALGPGCE